MPPLPQQRATRNTITSLPARFVNVSDGTTVSAFSGTNSPTGIREDVSAAITNEENLEATDEDLAQAIEQFLRLDNEGGDGGDSDVEGDECLIHTTGLVDDSRRSDDDVEYSPEDDRGEVKGNVLLTGTGGGTQIGTINVQNEEQSSFTVAERVPLENIKIPRAPDEYTAPIFEPSRNVPPFESVDNPGDWPEYCFQPEFNGNNRSRSSQFKQHQLPTGAVPFPKNEKNADGWQFYYNGWEGATKQYKRGATTANMFAKEMDGRLDANILLKLGLTQKRMETGDAAFFLQLILLFCDPSESGIPDDPRKPFFTEEERFTNMSKFESGKVVPTVIDGNQRQRKNWSTFMA